MHEMCKKTIYFSKMVFKFTSDIGLKMAFAGQETLRSMILMTQPWDSGY
jgi:hypothetical protein